MRVKGAVGVRTQQGDVPCLLHQGLWVFSPTSPCHHGEPRKRDAAGRLCHGCRASPGGTAGLCLSFSWSLSRRRRGQLGPWMTWEQGHLPTLPASSQGTRCHSASNSCPTGAEGLGLCCLQFHPRCPMGDEPLPGNKSPATKGTSGFPVPEEALLQSQRLTPNAAAACVSDSPPGARLCSNCCITCSP